MELISEIRAAINRCNREQPSNTPDFILAEYLLSCLEAFEVASLQREEWYGQHLSIKVNALLDTKDGKAHANNSQSVGGVPPQICDHCGGAVKKHWSICPRCLVFLPYVGHKLHT